MNLLPKYIDLKGYEENSQWLKAYISKTLGESFAEHIVQKDSYLKFPLIGDSSSVYIDTTLNQMYRWDEGNLKYYIVGSDWHNIELITGRTMLSE